MTPETRLRLGLWLLRVRWKSLLFIAARLKWQLGQTTRAAAPGALGAPVAVITPTDPEKLESSAALQGKCKKNWPQPVPLPSFLF